MAGRKKSVSVQEELLLCPSAKPGDWFPGIPVSAVAGIDEAGRGCLAGPVVAAAVIFARKARLFPALRTPRCCRLPAGTVWPPRLGLWRWLGGLASSGLPKSIASIFCRRRSRPCATPASVLKVRPKGLLIDGNQTIPEPLFRQRAACWPSSPRQKSIVDGDALVPVISAASIIAKTFRDMLMDKLDHRYPGYGFAKHKGYGSKEHFAALRELGPCPCTGRRSGAFCPNSRRRGRARFCDLAAGKGARRRGCRRGLAEKGRDADTRPQLAQRFV